MMTRHDKRAKREKKPATILRLAWHWGYQPGRVMREVLEWLEVLVVAGLIAGFILAFVTVRMHVPTDSMWPTINGDRSILRADSFFVDRLTYHFRDPTPGSIVVFRHTDNVSIRHVEPGSRADLAGVPEGAILRYVNREGAFTAPLVEEYIAGLPSGSRVTLMTSEAIWYDLGTMESVGTTLADLGITLREKRVRYVKRLVAVGGQTVQIKDGDIYVDGERLDDPRFDRDYVSDDEAFRFGIEPTLVPEDHYFMLGDNSAHSFDSRYWGFVDDRDIIGVPYLRVWPLPRFGLLR